MSAFVVSTTHIDALVTSGLVLSRGHYGLTWFDEDIPGWADGEWFREHRQELTIGTAQRVAGMLYFENWQSIFARYPDTRDEPENAPGKIGQPMPGEYEFRQLAGVPDPIDVLGMVACYEYQSCEHDGWRTSEAHAFCESLRELCCAILRERHGAPWEVSDRDYFRKRALVS